MQLSLTPHSETPCPALSAITATLSQTRGGLLVIDYAAMGEIDQVRWPPRALADRTDGLWQTSCFELFVTAPETTAYSEFNFSPSTAWAAYQFADYRDGMTDQALAEPPVIETTAQARQFSFRVTIPIILPANARVGLSAVIEQKDGTKSFWALAHPPGKPDFHHRDCFAHQVKAAGKS